MAQFELTRKLENNFDMCVKDADIYIRMGFIRKIYSILSVQLLLTCITGAILYAFKEPVQLFLSEKPYILLGLLISSIVFLVAMLFKRYEHPTNLILLLAFTFVEAFLVGIVVVEFDAYQVLQAFFITMGLIVGLTMYAMQTRRDFSSWTVYLSCGLLALIFGGISNLFFASSLLHMILSIGGAVLFSFMIISDTQIVMERLPAEEYVAATITLYLDFLNLFLHILRIYASKDH
ncbi:hypothetical protein Aperf_G00000050038 [Anoplocephala perfoliata]